MSKRTTNGGFVGRHNQTKIDFIYDEDSPLSYDYEGSLQVMQDNTAYYPIMLTYTGEMPMNDYEYVEHVNYSKIAKFNPMKKVYK